MKMIFWIGLLSVASVAASFEGLNDRAVVQQDRKESQLVDATFYLGQVDSTYVLGSGDLLEIVAENVNFSVRVGPEGYVLLNQVGGIKVSGMMLGEARRQILKSLSKNYRPERCFVTLGRPRVQMIGVYGAVRTPGVVSGPATWRLSKFVTEAGGIAIDGVSNEVLVKSVDGSQKKVDLRMIWRGEAEDPLLKEGDVIRVRPIDITKPLVWHLYNGNAIPQEWIAGKSAFEWLEMVGSLKNPFNVSGVLVNSKNGRKQMTLQESREYQVQVGDTLDIRQRGSDVFVGGVVMKPGPMLYVPLWRPIDYLASAGTQLYSSNFTEVPVIRADGKREMIDAVKGEVFPGDYLELPKSTIYSSQEKASLTATWVSIIAGSFGVAWAIYTYTHPATNYSKIVQ